MAAPLAGWLVAVGLTAQLGGAVAPVTTVAPEPAVTTAAVVAAPAPAALAFTRGAAAADFVDAPAAPDEGALALSLWRHRAPGGARPAREPQALGAERARILLRSLTLPGWGQATLGHRGSATFFGLTEAAIWGTFTAFRIQVALRQDAYLRTARLFAGIDLRGRDEEWRRIVGGYASSEEYNRLVVARDAANLYYDDPERYRAYIASHSLSGADSWSWASAEEQERYRGQRKRSQRAAQRANTALAVAVANRIVSALHAARASGQPAAQPRSWRLEVVPVAGDDPTAFQLRVATRFY